MNHIMFIPQGVSDGFAETSSLGFELITAEDIGQLMLERADDAYKGTYGDALLVCGSRGMAGAAILATGAALRSGCGKVTIHLPADERISVQANFPSALFSLDPSDWFSQIPDGLVNYSSVGVGPGLGKNPETVYALGELLKKCGENNIPTVIDADALNILADNPGFEERVPANSILTPHLGELKRLVGGWESEQNKLEKVIDLASRLDSVVVVKGPNTMICNRGISLVFNSTGNSGMAKGGSGDVLTGFITGLLSRGYSPYNAAVVGVFLHGLAGDKARDYYGAEGMNSADLIDFLAESLMDMK